MTREEINKAISDKESRIRELRSKLSENTSDIGDWKIIKIYEAKLLEKESPYDLEKLIEQREDVRLEINTLRSEIDKLNDMALEE